LPEFYPSGWISDGRWTGDGLLVDEQKLLGSFVMRLDGAIVSKVLAQLPAGVQVSGRVGLADRSIMVRLAASSSPATPAYGR
jgi:hypothetical protein